MWRGAESIRAFIEENKTAYYLYLTPGTKRYCPSPPWPLRCWALSTPRGRVRPGGRL